MNLIGVLIAFILILYLSSKEFDIGLSLLIGTVVAGVFSAMWPQDILSVFSAAIANPTTLELMFVVMIVSGLGYLLKQTGDMEKMIESLFNIFQNGKILSMLMPALLGTISFPGGAILSAPMVDKSGDKIDLTNEQKTVINIFYRHIGYFIYPLQSSIIITSQLFEVSILTIIRYNFLIMFFAFMVSYFVYFKDIDYYQPSESPAPLAKNIINFLQSFKAILTILILAIVIEVPFYLSVLIGLLLGAASNLPQQKRLITYFNRLKDFFNNGAKYKMALLIFGVMVFKEMVEASGSVELIAGFLVDSGIPLGAMIVLLGIIPGYLLGVNSASMGILIPIFAPLMPANAGPYIALLFTASFVGYLMSPIHLCLVLTKEYFTTDFSIVYKKLSLPVFTMILIGVIQLFIL